MRKTGTSGTRKEIALQEERIVEQEQVRAECKKEWEKATEELTKHYEQSIQLVTAEAKNT